METKASPKRKTGNLSDQLADIGLKLDHIIKRLQDSLYQQDLRTLGGDGQ